MTLDHLIILALAIWIFVLHRRLNALWQAHNINASTISHNAALLNRRLARHEATD